MSKLDGELFGNVDKQFPGQMPDHPTEEQFRQTQIGSCVWTLSPHCRQFAPTANYQIRIERGLIWKIKLGEAVSTARVLGEGRPSLRVWSAPRLPEWVELTRHRNSRSQLNDPGIGRTSVVKELRSL
jgi:hypothetical protein